MSLRSTDVLRKKRKLDHLKLVQKLGDGPAQTGFEDIYFIHNCLPEMDPSEIDTTVQFCHHTSAAPLMINAVTGGIREAEKVNRAFAAVARKLNIPMAVGSQAAALEDPDARYSYEVVREENPDGFIIANIGCSALPEHACEAVKMIEADALQVHLNAPQEAMMPQGEGDLSFRGCLEKITGMVKTVSVPVIVKEVGFGMAKEQAVKLLSTGIKALDVGGKGGTNFIKIEGYRYNCEAAQPFLNWGLSTAVSIIEVVESTGFQLEIVATGGIRSGLDVAKALSLGASLAAVAGPLVRCCYHGGETAVEQYLRQLLQELKQVMLMLGTPNLHALRQRPLVILGETGKWLERRGFDLCKYALRSGLIM
jgi:isopentenyl-diphosphate delta-isomerase